ncbi:MAG: hypothetical protein DI622_07435 [Chryseobacterium sp.]|uniref:hypothetical protein n=1 Tax=Chryseobacterium sp. TaxID=1871047 RepID=UPI000DB1E9AD|nr:hypothetical protein [Chryseobacterium sp.]MPS64519.1 hypothetical protein [Chryseobacterium sp.]PZU20924.1 MAG: hypothetical protein DI622_07435 [Chryseobacterium sp.]
MNIRIIQKQLIIANIILFVLSLAILEYSKLFRMSLEKHWIYSYGHNWWFMIAGPSAFWGSLILGIYSLWKVKNYKFLYFLFSLVPLILFIIIISI